MFMKKSENHPEELNFSHHARIRQGQRNITDSAVDTVMQSGEKIDCKNTKIYIDENTKMVLSNETNTVLTVNKNTRNTRFQLSERTKQKKESLLYKANLNNDHAMCDLAELYLSGELGEKNVQKAYNLFKRAAEIGNSHAMCKISQMYECGLLGTRNQELADKWLKRAADRSNVFALAIVGQRLLKKYQNKYPADSNIFRPSAPKKEILYYLNKAENKGTTRATWQLGHIYEKGLLGEKDLSKAREFYVKAAKQASPSSLGSLHLMTLECTFSVKELEDILDHVASFLPTTSIGMTLELGHKQLIRNLGYNPIRGLKMIEQAALKQYSQAMSLLTLCYRDGVRCDVNLKLAQYWYNKLHDLYDISAEEGNVNSLWKLGCSYLYGHSDEIDLKKAEFCFKKTVKISSDPDRIYNLGRFYLQGQLGEKPIDLGIELIAQAIKIWQLQVESGDTSAYSDLGYTYFHLDDDKKAVHWLSKAPDDDINAKLCLAEIYLSNISQEKNISLGLTILESLILDHDVSPSKAFEDVNFTVDEQTIQWLQDKAGNIIKPVCNKSSNQYQFQKFVVSTLAEVYETGTLCAINYDLAAKYYNQLFINFESIKAGNKLVEIYNDQHLPTEYYDTVKNWVLRMPGLIDTHEISWNDLVDSVLLLVEVYKAGNILQCNIQKATKWLYLALYYCTNDSNAQRIKKIECDLKQLPPLDCNQKVLIVSELSKSAESMKGASLLKYRIMSRILGDIFYDNEIVNRNIDKSIYWYSESAKCNNGLASFKLARIYQYDKQDINTSINWYMLSAQIGSNEAFDALKQMVHIEEHNSLSLFLNKYQHQYMVDESELVNIKPYKNLKFHPKTNRQMCELGKSYLNSEGCHDKLNAAFWFRKAVNNDCIDAAIELYSMYKSGILGINLVPCADLFYPDVMKICLSELKVSSKSHSQDISNTLLLLKNVSSALKLSDIPAINLLNKKIEQIISQTNINTKTIVDIISDIETIITVLKSKTSISNAIDVYHLASDVSHSFIV